MLNKRKLYKEIDKIMDCIDGNKQHPSAEEQLAVLILNFPSVIKENMEPSYNVSKPFRNIFENRFVKGDLAEIVVMYVLGQQIYHSGFKTVEISDLGTLVYTGLLYYYGIEETADHDRLLAAVNYLADTNRGRTADGFVEIGVRVAAADLMTNHCFDYPKDISESVSNRYFRQLDAESARSVRIQVTAYLKSLFKMLDQYDNP